MNVAVISYRAGRRRGIRVMLAWTAVGCAASGLAPPVQGQPVDPAASRNVQAIPTQSSTVDGQTSWIIEPEAPRIPKIAGLDPQLPPHVERRLSYAFDLAQRGASVHGGSRIPPCSDSAHWSWTLREGGTTRREALRDGLVALQEADEFGGDQVDWRDASDVRRIAAGHTTPVLANAQQPVDSIQAVQAYYLFAEQRLTSACQGMPGASLAFYGLGRTIVLPGTRIAHASGKAALYQRIALAIAPQNTLAANELGVLLAQHGQLDDAEKIFHQCVTINATPETWRNLAIVYSRKGNEQASRSALAAADALAAEKRNAAIQLAALNQSTAVAATKKKQEEEKKPSIFSKFNLKPKLPSVFHR